MKMLLFLLLQVTFLTTLAQGFDVDIHIPTSFVNPETTVPLNCTFDRTYEQTTAVFIYNGKDELMYGHDYVNNTGFAGEGYEDMVSNPQAESGWFSITFTVPYCYKDNMFKCHVYDWNEVEGSDSHTFFFGLPEVPQPHIYIDGSCMTCSDDEVFYRLSKESAGNVKIQCRVDHVLPEATFFWPGAFTQEPGSETSVENPETCTLNQTAAASANLAYETLTACYARNIFGIEKSKYITIAPYTGVELLLPATMEESTTVTLNCTSDVSMGDPYIVGIFDGSYHDIYNFHYSSGRGEVGDGFEDIVSNPRTGENGRWAAIDFTIPIAYGDTAFECWFLGKSDSLGMDRRIFKSFYKVIN